MTAKLRQWLERNGELTKENVVDYFQQCPLYDPTATYSVVGVTSQQVFVIEEKRPEEEQASAYYSIVNKGITAAPTLLNLVSSCVRKSTHCVTQALKELSDAIRVDPVAGVIWDPPDYDELTSSAGSGSDSVASSVEVREPPPPAPLPQIQLLSADEMNMIVREMIGKINQVCLSVQHQSCHVLPSFSFYAYVMLCVMFS